MANDANFPWACYPRTTCKSKLNVTKGGIKIEEEKVRLLHVTHILRMGGGDDLVNVLQELGGIHGLRSALQVPTAMYADDSQKHGQHHSGLNR